MALKTVYSAESWTRVYSAFSQINFSALDFDTIKASLLQYIQTYYAESFNSLIESSEMIMLIESFAYIAEQLNYRIDMTAQENFISTASRKQSILKLAKIISYKPTRNIPARSLVKISSISTTESIVDATGNNLSKKLIIWNDANNVNWKSQFFLLMNAAITSTFGQYNNTAEIGGVIMQTYTFNNNPALLNNGVFSFSVDTGLETFPMEIVSMDIDSNGPFERTPDVNSQLSFMYSSDGLGDGSDYTGFQFLIKQGALTQIPYTFSEHVPNRSITLNVLNINDTDVWLNGVDSTGKITSVWTQVQSLLDQNIAFNDIISKTKYEVETLENDAVKLIFGDGDFAEMPFGDYQIWVRQSINQSVVILPQNISNKQFSFQYTSSLGKIETCSMTFSLNSTIQNSAASESIEHIRQSAPSTHYAQDRMVNGQDYNTYMLKDQSILRLNSINRTFAGQPKYITWNDASGQYENIKLFGDDLQISQNSQINTINTDSSIIGRNLIDNVIEPILSSNGIINILNYINTTNPSTSGLVVIPRRQFIDDNRQIYFNYAGTRANLLEKTTIQGAIDQHFYGEPLTFVQIPLVTGASYALIKDPSIYPTYNGQLWLNSISRTVDGLNPYIPGDAGSGLQPQSSQQKFGLCFNNSSPIIGTNLVFNAKIDTRVVQDALHYEEEIITIEVAGNGNDLFVSSSIRGALGIGRIGVSFQTLNPTAILDFTLVQSPSPSFVLQYGDTIKLELLSIQKTDWDASSQSISTTSNVINGLFNLSMLNILGRWEVITGIELGTTPNNLPFDPTLYLDNGKRNPSSWIIWVEQKLNPVTQLATSFVVNYRELSLQVSSANTQFWYNSNQSLIDSVTQNVVYDQIRVLRSNLRPDGKPIGYNGDITNSGKYIGHNEIYSVVGAVKDKNSVIDMHSLEIMVSDGIITSTGGEKIPSNILQFNNFIDASNNSSSFYLYFQIDAFGQEIPGTETSVIPTTVSFNPGAFGSSFSSSGIRFGRKLQRSDIDFMWQHFTGFSNMVDPSVSNIHDTYIITQGYYDNMVNYLTGSSPYLPSPPTPLELRNDYGYLLDKKMLSDTIVLHSGTFKLLFGNLAEPQLRGQFNVVQSSTSTLSQERIKLEVLNVIIGYFSIANWDYGQTFFVTELLGLIHQRLPTDISTVVLVPTYSVNSFGSMFQVQSGIDEILMSAATIDNIIIVPELNSTILRQGSL